jgi:hypothetical protein
VRARRSTLRRSLTGSRLRSQPISLNYEQAFENARSTGPYPVVRLHSPLPRAIGDLLVLVVLPVSGASSDVEYRLRECRTSSAALGRPLVLVPLVAWVLHAPPDFGDIRHTSAES